jgi:hypothetical protein
MHQGRQSAIGGWALLSLVVDWWAAAPQGCGVYARYGSNGVLCIREKIEPLDCSMRDYDLRESTAMEALKQNLSGEKGQLQNI